MKTKHYELTEIEVLAIREALRCTVKLADFEKTETGKSKIWRTDGVKTFCC